MIVERRRRSGTATGSPCRRCMVLTAIQASTVIALTVFAVLALSACGGGETYDVVLHGGRAAFFGMLRNAVLTPTPGGETLCRTGSGGVP